MKKITLLCLSLLMTGAMVAGNTDTKIAERIKQMNDPNRLRVAVMGQNLKTATNFQLEKAGIKAANIHKNAADTDGSIASITGPHYGILQGPEGDMWFYTQNTVTENFRDKSSEIVIYDNNHEEAGRINFIVPEGKSVNSIEPVGQITKKMFDRDEQTLEVAVYVHYLGDNYINTDSTLIFNMEGKKVCGYEGQLGSIINIQQNEWTTYQRAIIQRSAFSTDEATGKSYIEIDILKPAGWGETEPTVEHSFFIDYDLIQYSDGPAFTICEIDNSPYYVLSYYKDTYVTGYDSETFDMIVRENNEYVLDVYDSNYERVDSFGVKLEKPEDALYRFGAFSMFSGDDMSKGYFTNDGNMNYVVTLYDYLTSTDEYRYDFCVYNGKGEEVKTICKGVENVWFKLIDIKGHESQWAFMQTVDDNQQIQMVDLPSCENAIVIPAEIDGEMISTTLNRYPKGDSYQYAISMGYAETDKDNNVISRIGWYNKDLTLDRFVRFNLGPNGQYFTPLLSNESLDPYVFDTDEEHEYPFLAKIKREDSNIIDNTIVIGKEDGSVLREFRGDDSKAVYTGAIINYGMANQEFFVTLTDGDNYDVNYYSLPFNKFAKGGDGTPENPYLIATAGDMQQIKAEPDACYKLVADIDMSEYPGNWTPIETFNGTLDGDGHALSNFTINTTEYNVGIFSMLGANSKIKNLIFINPEISVSANNSYVGVIAGQAITDSISNVHIYNANISGQGAAVTGGIIGQSSLNGIISASSFDGVIDLPNSTEVGGIAGNTRTNTNIYNCSTSGVFTAGNTLGGIVGTTGTDAKVYDCHTDIVLKAKNTIGGIIGNNGSRATVSRCYSEGTIEATEAGWDGLAAGGIIGSLNSDWSSSSNVIVSGCVSAADIITDETDNSVHRIVGWTIANESYEPGETVRTEMGLSDNYALSTTTIGGQTITSDDATSTDGATKKQSELNKEFFTSLNYAYGSSETEPWKGENIPVLWFEDIANALVLSANELTLKENETAEITATVYGTDASAITFSSSDQDVAVINLVSEEDNKSTIRIEGRKYGTAIITASADKQTVECVLNVTPSSGIDAANTTSESIGIRINDGKIEAAGADNIRIYNVNGQLAAHVNGSILNTTNMSKGIYIVIATDTKGNTTTGKAVIK